MNKVTREQTLDALNQSITKWEKITTGRGWDNGAENCALCQLFNYTYDCIGCPIFTHTGEGGCEKTPYDVWRRVFGVLRLGYSCVNVALDDKATAAAQAELDFLRMIKELFLAGKLEGGENG